MTDTPQTKTRRRHRGPSPAKTAATQLALVEAGLTIFLERGYGATRMSDVAARAGLGKGTIYLHFADKTELFAAVLSRVAWCTRAGRPIPRPSPNEPTHAFLRRVVRPFLVAFQGSGLSQVILLVASEGSRLPEVANTYRQVVIDPVLRMVRVYARRAERRGELHGVLLSGQPLLMVAPVVVTTLWNNLFAGPEPIDVAAMFDLYLDLLFEPRSGGLSAP